MPGIYLYRVSYKGGKGTGDDSYEVSRVVRTNTGNLDDLVKNLGSRWTGRRITRVEILEPIEEL